MDFDPSKTQPPRKRVRLSVPLLMLAPFVFAIACIGLGALAFGQFGERAVISLLGMRVGAAPERVGIPVTGGAQPTPKPVLPPEQQRLLPEAEGYGYLLLAQEQMASCYDSFGAFVDLEQLVFEEPALFKDAVYRDSAQQAAGMFRSDCEALHALPAAPPAYRELDKWLRLSADEAGLAADHFMLALEAGQSGVFSSRSMHLTVEHLLNFIDYSHNAASILEFISQRHDL